MATDLVRLVILIAFPLLATWLPQRMMAGVHYAMTPVLETRYVFTITAQIGE